MKWILLKTGQRKQADNSIYIGCCPRSRPNTQATGNRQLVYVRNLLITRERRPIYRVWTGSITGLQAGSSRALPALRFRITFISYAPWLSRIVGRAPPSNLSMTDYLYPHSLQKHGIPIQHYTLLITKSNKNPITWDHVGGARKLGTGLLREIYPNSCHGMQGLGFDCGTVTDVLRSVCASGLEVGAD